MLLQSIKMQIKVLSESKLTLLTFFVLFAWVLLNFLTNVFTYHGRDVLAMYHPMKILSLTWSGSYNFYFRQYFPLLVILPAGFAYVSDRSSKSIAFILSRVGAKNYYLGKFIAVFIVTFTVFTIPFLIEVILNCLAFPLHAIGDPSNVGTYDASYQGWVKSYLVYKLYVFSPYIYAVLFIAMVGTISGSLAVFTVAVSTFSFMKFRIFLFLPVYSFLYILAYLRDWLHLKVSTNYFYYLSMFESGPKSGFGVIFITVFLLCTSLFIFLYKEWKDPYI